MNFLAHSMFADQNAELMVGQFCGDFVRGGDLEEFSPTVRKGIRLHRAIDSFTDKHPVNLEARSLFQKPLRRYAGILTDVVYDHYLARTWAQYSALSLDAHATVVHEALDGHFEILPRRLQHFARFMIDKQILVSYRHFDAVETALRRLSRRSDRFLLLDRAAAEINRLDVELSTCFSSFYPDLISHMATME